MAFWKDLLFGSKPDMPGWARGDMGSKAGSSWLAGQHQQMLQQEPIQRLMSSEGRGAMMAEMSGQINRSFEQAQTAGLGGLSRAGVGPGAMGMFGANLESARSQQLTGANIRATMGAAGAVSQIFGQMHQQQAGIIGQKYAGAAALAGRPREGGLFDLGMAFLSGGGTGGAVPTP